MWVLDERLLLYIPFPLIKLPYKAYIMQLEENSNLVKLSL